jgi:oxalate decarboxylase
MRLIPLGNGVIPQPMRGGKGADDPGPRNVERDRQNPDLLASPETDHGTLPNMKFSFSDAHNRLEKGGWAREVTQRELPVAREIAGVNMRLLPGAFREMHWHKQAEWSYMLEGRARITAVDENGRNFIDDVGVGDLWYFPPGIPHSIQALREGCEFLLVFNDGNFSESGTFLITDWLAHTPREVLAANFQVSENEFRGIPESELYIFPGKVPGPIANEQVAAPPGQVPRSFSFRLHEQEPVRSGGGWVRIADSTNFAASRQIAAALVEIEPGGLREMHWHPNADEWQYYISGRGRMTVFATQGTARTFDFQAGDVGYVPFAMGHYVQNTGKVPLRFLEMFASERFADVSLNQWMALTPKSIVEQHLHLGGRAMAALRKEKRPVVAK